MAAGIKLQLGFRCSDGKSRNFSYNYAKQTATTSNVKNLMNTIIANKDIFENTPVAIESAKTVITTENVYDLSD